MYHTDPSDPAVLLFVMSEADSGNRDSTMSSRASTLSGVSGSSGASRSLDTSTLTSGPSHVASESLLDKLCYGMQSTLQKQENALEGYVEVSCQ